MASLSRRTEMTKLPQLPKALDKMDSFALKELIAELLSRDFSNGKYLGQAIMKPLWWPKRAPWPYKLAYNRKDMMRQVIESCYSFYDQEKCLKGPQVAHEEPGSRSTRTLARESVRQSSSSKSSPASSGRGQSIKVVSNIDGSVSYVADNVLATKENQENAPQFQCKVSTAFEAALPEEKAAHRNVADVPSQPGESPTAAHTADCAFIEIFICFFCEQEFSHKVQLNTHQKDCKQRPPELQLIGTPPKTRRQLYPPGILSQTGMAKTQRFEKPKPLEKSDFASALGLVTKTKAVSLKKEKKTSETDIEILEVEEAVPQTPTTPRTPKSLISQLSRDASPPPIVNKNLGVVKVEQESDNESEVSDKGEERRPHRTQRLFNIDLCSQLGQRVKKHFDMLTEKPGMEEVKEKHKNYEVFCHTPKKSVVRDKLRDRNTAGYPVSFRKRPPKHVHTYSFNKEQRKEKLMVLKTGLTSRARALKRLAKKCSVELTRVSKSEIKKWAMRKPMRFGYSPGRHAGGQNLPVSPVFMSNSDLQRLLCVKMPDGMTSAFQVMMPNSYQSRQNTTTALSPSASPQNTSHISPTLVGPLVITPNRQRPMPTPGSVLQSLLTRPIPGAHPAISPHKFLQNPQHWNPTGSYPKPRPSFSGGGKTQQDDEDVISISSDESSGGDRKSKSKKRAASPSSSESSLKRRKVDEGSDKSKPVALLFRCHLCNAALTCKQNAKQVIQGHFANLHKVFNIDLIEHEDARGNKVMSIVEVANPSSPMSGPSETDKSPASTVKQSNSLWQKSGPVVDLTEEDDEEEPTRPPQRAPAPIKASVQPSTSRLAVKKQPTARKRFPQAMRVKPTVSPSAANKSPDKTQTSSSSSPTSSQSTSPMTRASRKLFQDTEPNTRRSQRRHNADSPVTTSAK